MSEERQEKQEKPSVIKTSNIMAAGMASAVAAFFTSSIGVAGTLIGAAMTSMIITTGSAFLNVKLEGATSRLGQLPREVKEKVAPTGKRSPQNSSDRNGTDQSPAQDPAREPEAGKQKLGRERDVSRQKPLPQGMSLYGGGHRGEAAAAGAGGGSGGERGGGRQRFSNLSPRKRRSVLVGGVAAGALAFAISMGGITGIETLRGETLSCWIWSNCSTSTGVAGTPGQGPSSSLGALTQNIGGGSQTAEDPSQQPANGLEDPDGSGGLGNPFDDGQDVPDQQPGVPGGDGSGSEGGGSWIPGGGAPEQPAPEQQAPEQPAPEQPAPEQPAPEQPVPGSEGGTGNTSTPDSALAPGRD